MAYRCNCVCILFDQLSIFFSFFTHRVLCSAINSCCAYRARSQNVWQICLQFVFCCCLFSKFVLAQVLSWLCMCCIILCWFNPRPHMLFSHPRTHMGGGCNPHAISPLIEIELWAKDQTNPWDVLNPMVPELTSWSYLDPSRSDQRKKDSDLRIYRFSQITFELRKIAE